LILTTFDVGGTHASTRSKTTQPHTTTLSYELLVMFMASLQRHPFPPSLPRAVQLTLPPFRPAWGIITVSLPLTAIPIQYNQDLTPTRIPMHTKRVLFKSTNRATRMIAVEPITFAQ